MSEIKPFVPWGGVTPHAILQQLSARFVEHRADKCDCILMAVRIYKTNNGLWVYQCYNSAGAVEPMLMGCRELERFIMKENDAQS